MEECRCKKCQKLLFKYRRKGEIEVAIKCPRCGEINMVTTESLHEIIA